MKKITFTIPWPLTADDTRELLSFAFQTALISYLGFTLLEQLFTGFVSNYINLNIILWVTVGCGALTAIWPMATVTAKPGKIGWKSIGWLVILAALAGWVVWYKIGALGNIRLPIAALSAIIVAGLGFLIYFDNDHPDQSDG